MSSLLIPSGCKLLNSFKLIQISRGGPSIVQYGPHLNDISNLHQSISSHLLCIQE